MRKIFIIAEAGVNHNGLLEMARELVKKAKECGADCVKFQTFKADRVVSQSAAKARYQMETTDPKESQLEMLRKLELPDEAYPELMQVCAEEGIMFLSTPYDREDVDFLDELGVEAFKVASGQVVEPYFLEYITRKGKPMILSTGMATLGEVDEAVRVVRERSCSFAENKYRLPPLTLLHCNTNYPCLLEEANLRAMQTMRHAFSLPVGYSDHTEGIMACIVAVALGAEVIEKHFTLDRTLPGPDQACSSDPSEFKQMVTAVRQTQVLLGSGIKEPTASEKENARVMRRSLVARRDLSAGKTLTSEDVSFRRPYRGLPVNFLDLILGKTIRAPLKKDAFLDLEIVSQ